jgi:hypothetical protein
MSDVVRLELWAPSSQKILIIWNTIDWRRYGSMGWIIMDVPRANSVGAATEMADSHLSTQGYI